MQPSGQLEKAPLMQAISFYPSEIIQPHDDRDRSRHNAI